MTKLIIFDFDGTLGDTRRNIVTTMQMTARALGLPGRTDDECAATIGLPLDGCFEALYPRECKETILLCTDTYRRIFQTNLLTMKPQAFPKVKAGCRRYERGYPDGQECRCKGLRGDLRERN
jgi:phosphoglycolate phosphatase